MGDQRNPRSYFERVASRQDHGFKDEAQLVTYTGSSPEPISTGRHVLVDPTRRLNEVADTVVAALE